MTENSQRPPAQHLDRRLDDNQGAEREGQNRQKISVGVEYRFVDNELDLERRCEGGNLQHHRERDHLGERGPRTGHLQPQVLQADRGAGMHRAEACRRSELEHDAGEMLGYAQGKPERLP
jgi:hypothetical protein